MRLLLQIVVLGALVVLGWNTPFRDTAKDVLPWAEISSSRLAKLKTRKPAPLPPEPPQPPRTPAPRPPINSSSTLNNK